MGLLLIVLEINFDFSHSKLSNAFHIGKKSPVAEILKDAIDDDS
nr:9707_t:CDS:2 [Entrophospora candida]